ncbi:glycosyltransferase involved in cell wall biosynthesis [Pseudarthrobacter siccitolerans]|uniref:Glycosyltransferase involved in cell wall biosynthesis n=2 Tax=Pseudarthrobacter siccitolerans TaxID=861266 RepID=A0ABU0PJ79_9MICC|nr:glycosyltransferase involved in cell wall biosynthesis [Pseudarthrobacter siccitolerans]
MIETGTGGQKMGRLMSALESKILCSADGIAAIHDRFKQHMVEALGVKAERVHVIRNWTHLPASPASGNQEMRERLGWAPSDIIVLHAGNMGKKQGLDNVIEAARLSDLRQSAVRFVLMGDGNQRKRLELMAEGVDSVKFMDSLPDEQFQQALATADALLVNEMPGIKDMAVPSKLTSYFNAGVPVIAATDAESVTASEIQRSGGGVRVNSSDPQALIDAAEALAREPALAARLAENALRFRRETLSEDVAIGKYDDFITSLASSRGR